MGGKEINILMSTEMQQYCYAEEYGVNVVSDAVYKRSNSKLSLSRMTFSHQMVRAIFAEQIYRAFTIMRGEPYHHE